MSISSKSVSLFFSCAWGKLRLTHVGPAISIKHDSILLTCLTITSAVSGEGVNGETMPPIPTDVQGVGRTGFWPEWGHTSHHKLSGKLLA